MRLPVNPYRWDLVDPERFYGRNETVVHLLDRLLAGDRFAVAGGRRMGKTTLLRRLEADLASIGSEGGLLVVPVFVDMAELYSGSMEDAYALLALRVRVAAQAAHLATDDPDVTSGPEFAESLRALLRSTRRLGRLQFVFLFDEIERVVRAEWGSGFLAYWRMILNNMGELSRCVSAVFSGAAAIYQIAQDAGSPLGNILAWHELELFSFEETARLVREPSGHPWPELLWSGSSTRPAASPA